MQPGRLQRPGVEKNLEGLSEIMPEGASIITKSLSNTATFRKPRRPQIDANKNFLMKFKDLIHKSIIIINESSKMFQR